MGGFESYLSVLLWAKPTSQFLAQAKAEQNKYFAQGILIRVILIVSKAIAIENKQLGIIFNFDPFGIKSFLQHWNESYIYTDKVCPKKEQINVIVHSYFKVNIIAKLIIVTVILEEKNQLS